AIYARPHSYVSDNAETLRVTAREEQITNGRARLSLQRATELETEYAQAVDRRIGWMWNRYAPRDYAGPRATRCVQGGPRRRVGRTDRARRRDAEPRSRVSRYRLDARWNGLLRRRQVRGNGETDSV